MAAISWLTVLATSIPAPVPSPDELSDDMIEEFAIVRSFSLVSYLE